MTAKEVKRRGLGKELGLTRDEQQAQERLKSLWDSKAPQLGVTQKALAASMAVNPSLISQYLNWYIPLNTQALLKFAAALNIDPSEVWPEKATLFAMAKTSQRLKITARLTKDNRVVIPLTEEDLGGWTAPTPTAKAILVERDTMPDICPNGTVIVYDSGTRLTIHAVMAAPKGMYVVFTKSKRVGIHLCKVDMSKAELVDLETKDTIVGMTDADGYANVEVYKVIAKMCLSGVMI